MPAGKLDDDGHTNVSEGRLSALNNGVPAYVLQGDATFEPTAWNDYRQRMDQLSHDDRFMHYLTAPVMRRCKSSQSGRSGKSVPQHPQLAVNKLYPLAFIRLLEAHAKHSAECDEQSRHNEHARFGYGEPFDQAFCEQPVVHGTFLNGRLGSRDLSCRRRSCDPHGNGTSGFGMTNRSRSSGESVRLINGKSKLHHAFRSGNSHASTVVPVC